MDKSNIKIDGLTVNSMVKVFLDSDNFEQEISNTMLTNEKFHFQLALKNYENYALKHIKINVISKLVDNITLRKVENVPCQVTSNVKFDDYYEKTEPGLYPDVLMPFNNGDLILPVKKWKSVWFTLENKKQLKPDVYPIIIQLIDEEDKLIKEFNYKITVIDERLEENDLIMTNWIHYDCISNTHNVKPFSKKFYSVFDKYLNAYIECGNTMLLTPLFTSPLDTEVGRERITCQLVDVTLDKGEYSFNFDKLKYFMNFAVKHGIKYFELSHLFTQWGGEYCPKIMAVKDGEYTKIFGWDTLSKSSTYKMFLDNFLPKLIEFLKKNNLEKKCYFHLTDEPKEDQIDNYLYCRQLVKEHIGDIPIMDALSEYSFYEKSAVDIAIPCTHVAHEFLSRGITDILLYYCCVPTDGYYSNRFISMCSHRNRILGFQLYLTGVKGFLHWGFNFYNSAFSLYTVNPYEDTSAGGFFPGGDSFIVYPAKEDVHKSIRYEIFNDGIQDYRACKSLEKKFGREFVIKLLKDEGLDGLNKYPRSLNWHNNFRNIINKLISEAN